MGIADIIGTFATWLTGRDLAKPDLEMLGRAALEQALGHWHEDIYDPPRGDTSIRGLASKNAIDGFIRHGLGWDWEPPYAGDGSFEWCGAFAAMCWPGIKRDLRKTYFASTYRLDRYARGGSVNGEANAGGERLLAECDERTTALPWQPRAGDIVTIGPAGSGYGKHICLVERVDGAKVYTVEGNGTGMGPDGKHRQGVVRGIRAIGMAGMRELGTTWHVRRVIRPAVADIG